MDLSKINLDRFISIDVETTGLDSKNDKIIEISAVKFSNNKVVDKFTKLINPEKKIPSFIQNLTGIKNEHVEDAPFFNEISNDLIKFWEVILIGHFSELNGSGSEGL